MALSPSDLEEIEREAEMIVAAIMSDARSDQEQAWNVREARNFGEKRRLSQVMRKPTAEELEAQAIASSFHGGKSIHVTKPGYWKAAQAWRWFKYEALDKSIRRRDREYLSFRTPYGLTRIVKPFRVRPKDEVPVDPPSFSGGQKAVILEGTKWRRPDRIGMTRDGIIRRLVFEGVGRKRASRIAHDVTRFYPEG
jgi:hypothetical protein